MNILVLAHLILTHILNVDLHGIQKQVITLILCNPISSVSFYKHLSTVLYNPIENEQAIKGQRMVNSGSKHNLYLRLNNTSITFAVLIPLKYQFVCKYNIEMSLLTAITEKWKII